MSVPSGNPEKPMAPEASGGFDLAAALGAMQGSPSDDGLSLDELNRSYAAMLGADDPYLEAEPPPGWETGGEASQEAATLLGSAKLAGLTGLTGLTGLAGLAHLAESPLEIEPAGPPAEDQCAITPSSIWESILFVGQPGNVPIRARDVAKLMRGVTPSELDDMVLELNQTYEAEEAPYRIVSVGDGYRMELTGECRDVEVRMLGKAKEAKLSQAHVDVLAIVAYHQPVTSEDVQNRRGKPSGSALRQLVRRGLLAVERGETRGQERYRTTTRFLKVFQLKGLSDLPQIQDLDRSL